MKGKNILLIFFVSILVGCVFSDSVEKEDPSFEDDETTTLAKIDERLSGSPKKAVDEWNTHFQEVSHHRLNAMTHHQDEILTALRKMGKARSDLIDHYKFLVKRRHDVRNYIEQIHLKKGETGHHIYVPSEKTCFDQLMGLLKNKLYMSHSEWQSMYTSYINECKKSRPNYIYVISHHKHHHHFYVTHVAYDPISASVAGVRHGFSNDEDVIADNDEGDESPKDTKVHPSLVPGYFGVGYHPFDILHPTFDPYYLPPFHGLSPTTHWLAEYNHYMKCNKEHFTLQTEKENDDKYKEWIRVCHPDEHIRRIHEHLHTIHGKMLRVDDNLKLIKKSLEKQREEWKKELTAKEGESTYDQLHRIWCSMKERRDDAVRREHCAMVRTRMIQLRDAIENKAADKKWEKTYFRFRSTCYEEEFKIEPTKKLEKKVNRLTKEVKLKKKLATIEKKEKKTKSKLKKTEAKPDTLTKTYRKKIAAATEEINDLMRQLKENKQKNAELLLKMEAIQAKKTATDKSNEILKNQKRWKKEFGIDILGKQARDYAKPMKPKDKRPEHDADDLAWWVKHTKE